MGIGFPLAQYAGFGAPVKVAGGGPVIVVSRTLSNAELLALNATPLTMISGKANTLLVPFVVSCRSIKPGAAAWTTAPNVHPIFEGDNTNAMASSIPSLLNTAVAIDTLLMDDGINTTSFNLLGFNRIGKAIQVRSSVVPNQGAGSNATIVYTVAAYKCRI